ncbi:MAG: Glutamyl-tRNA reductase [Calditrichaeota bacterium]|nr:Glutamyl-tRNA reductase [Calditrichota bacterium]
MILSVFGYNHRTASLADREPFQLQREGLADAVLAFKRISGAEETAVLATCNRVEFYRVQPSRAPLADAVVEFYRAHGVAEPERIAGFGYGHIGAAAARHLFRVASGMDSMILGEEQVLGQVRHAYSTACRAGGPGKVLHKLFHHSFRVAKRVRAETPLGEGIRSLPGAAVELLLAGLEAERPRALVVGANDTTAVVLNHLARHGIDTVLVNRTRAHAQALAAPAAATVADWDALAEELARADLLFTATAAPGALIGARELAARNACPLRIADLSVPRDVDPDAAARAPGVELIDLDRLHARLKEVNRRRYEHLPEAQGLIEQQVEQFLEWLHAQLFAGGIEAVKHEMHAAADEEMRRFRPAFHKSETKALEAYGHALLKRFLKSATRHFEPLDFSLSDPPAPKFDPAALEIAFPGMDAGETRPVSPDDPTTRLSCRELRARKASTTDDTDDTDRKTDDRPRKARNTRKKRMD